MAFIQVEQTTCTDLMEKLEYTNDNALDATVGLRDTGAGVDTGKERCSA
jgi:hypothetical protein